MHITDNVIFSTSISIITFFLGFIIHETILLYSRNKKLQQSEKHIKLLFKNLIKFLPLQLESYKKLLDNIEKEEYRNWFVTPHLRLENILQKEELIFTLIVNRKKGQNNELIFSNLINQCYLIHLVINETNKIFEETNQLILNYENKLDNTGVRLYQKIMEIKNKNIKSVTDKKILSIYDNFVRTKITPRQEIHKGLIQKIENLALENNENTLLEYLDLTSVFNKDYLYYQETRNQLRSKIKEYYKDLEQSYEKLIEDFDKYKKLKWKSNLSR